MPEYNINYNSDLGLDLGTEIYNNLSDFSKRNIFGTPPPSDVMRYPLKAIEKEQDMLLIRIFDQVQSGQVFGLPSEDKKEDTTSGQKSISIGALPEKNKIFNKQGSTYDGEKSLKANARYIWLPIPQQVSDSITVDYSEDTLNPLQAAGLQLSAETIKEGPIVAAGKVMNLLKQASSNINNIDPRALDALQTTLAGQAINQLGANVNPTSLITRSSGQILQSNLELLFNKMTLRSFPFTFDFTPRDPDEAEMVKKIIRTIKKATVPKRGDGIFINSPDLFQFQYVAGGERQHPFLNRFKVGVIENVSVDYTASGTYATYSDRTPVHIRMTLAFKEINPIYMEDYDDAASEGAEGPGIHGVGY